MLTILLAATAIVLGSCAVMIGPTLVLARLGWPKSAFMVALATTSALVVDFNRNWGGISYPHWLLSAPTTLFPLTILVGVAAVAVGFKALFDEI